MAKQREYKNIYTIMEKAKKGELELDFGSPSLYSNMKYNVRDDIISPYLHYLDERALQRAVEQYIGEPSSHRRIKEIAVKYNKAIVSPDTLIPEMQGIYRKFPKTIVNDMFNINYEDITDLHFKDREEKNTLHYQMIEKANDPVSKIITGHDHTKSMIYTRSVVQYYLFMLAMLQQEDKIEFDIVMGHLTGLSPGTSKAPGNEAGTGDEEETLEKHLKTLKERFDKSPAGKKIYDDILETAKKTADVLDDVMPDIERKQMWRDLGGNNSRASDLALNKTNLHYLENIQKELNKVAISLGGIKNKIRNLLDKSTSYFSGRDKIYFESIFDSGSLGGLEDLELFHPILKKINIEDINTKEVKKMGKIDIYLDASGSMNSGYGIMDNKFYSMTKILFAKAFTYKMKEMDLLNRIYSFQHSVKYEGTGVNDILTITGGGGTSLDSVIRSIEENGRNAIIITDAEDSCRLYSNKAYFIGIKGANFSGFHPDYLSRGQAIVFDGDRIYSVDQKGKAII